MRYLIVVAALAVAAPAAAQLPVQAQVDNLRIQQEAAQRAAVETQNQLMVLEARMRADQATYDLQRATVRAPELRYDIAPSGVATSTSASAKYPSIPDSALADSNRRVQDAARKPR